MNVDMFTQEYIIAGHTKSLPVVRKSVNSTFGWMVQRATGAAAIQIHGIIFADGDPASVVPAAVPRRRLFVRQGGLGLDGLQS